MRGLTLSIIAALSMLLSSYADASECDKTSREVSVRIDAAALAQRGSWVRVCIDGLCNEDESPDAGVSVAFPDRHPATATYSVTRIAGSGVSVGIARGVLNIS